MRQRLAERLSCKLWWVHHWIKLGVVTMEPARIRDSILVRGPNRMDWLTLADQVFCWFPGTISKLIEEAKNKNVDKHIKSEYVPVEPLVIFQVLCDVLSCDQGSEGNDWHEEPLLFVGYRREH